MKLRRLGTILVDLFFPPKEEELPKFVDEKPIQKSSPSGVGWPLGLSQQDREDIICDHPTSLETPREKIVVGSNEWYKRIEETRGKWDNLVDIAPPAINWFCTYKLCKCNPDEQSLVEDNDLYCGCYLLDDGYKPNRCKECLAILSWEGISPTTEQLQQSQASGYFGWQDKLENALGVASPKEVLDIIHSIKGWLVGYCENCGIYSASGGGKINCGCKHKGEWNKNLAPQGMYSVWCEPIGHIRSPEWLRNDDGKILVTSYEEATKEADYCNRHNKEWNYSAKPGLMVHQGFVPLNKEKSKP